MIRRPPRYTLSRSSAASDVYKRQHTDTQTHRRTHARTHACTHTHTFTHTHTHTHLPTIIKRRKLQWYGHVSRSLGLAKTTLQGTVKGGRRQSRQRKRWETTSGNGQAWSSPSPRGQLRTGKNGENWLQNHLWCPNDPRG